MMINNFFCVFFFNFLYIIPVFSKPAEKSLDYQNDKEGDYDDESEQRDTSNDVNSKQSNSLPSAFFRSKNYTETYQPEKSVTLKCDVENFDNSKRCCTYCILLNCLKMRK